MPRTPLPPSATPATPHDPGLPRRLGPRPTLNEDCSTAPDSLACAFPYVFASSASSPQATTTGQNGGTDTQDMDMPTSAPPSSSLRSTSPTTLSSMPSFYWLNNHYSPKTKNIGGENITSQSSQSQSTNPSTSLPPLQALTISPSAPATSTTASPTSKPHHTNAGAIAGGVIAAVLVLSLALAGAVHYICRRRRKARQPPSAEFMHIARGQSALGFASPTIPVGTERDGKTTPTLARLLPLSRRGTMSDEEEAEEAPPAFTPGAYGDPVLEKVQASAELQEKYWRMSMSEEGYGHQ